MSNPFHFAKSEPGTGSIHLALLPPSTPRLRTVNYQYPLKVVAPAPLRTSEPPHHLVHTIYTLTYGGGLVAGDSIDLKIIVEKSTRLVLLTQGSTKIFKSSSRGIISRQVLDVRVEQGGVLCYLPDPVQPFEESCFEGRQVYRLIEGKEKGSLCVLDWVTKGRGARGEEWDFWRYGSRNEIFFVAEEGTERLVLRDAVVLDDEDVNIRERMAGLAVFGTLIMCGPVFEHLQRFFMDEFKALPRVGGRKWDRGSDDGNEDECCDAKAVWRAERLKKESEEGFLWSAADVRGCVVVKFGAKEVENARSWLRSMLAFEGTVEREVGERGLMCLR